MIFGQGTNMQIKRFAMIFTVTYHAMRFAVGAGLLKSGDHFRFHLGTTATIVLNQHQLLFREEFQVPAHRLESPEFFYGRFCHSVEGATDDEALLPLIFCLCCFHTS